VAAGIYWSATAAVRATANASGGSEASDEAHLPTEEAQASPRARVQGAHALARRQADAQAQARKGAKAPVRLTVIGAR
jgi:hypothetical protein